MWQEIRRVVVCVAYMCVCAWMCVYVCVCMHVCVCIYEHMHVLGDKKGSGVCMHLCVHVLMCMCVCTHLWECVWIREWTCGSGPRCVCHALFTAALRLWWASELSECHYSSAPILTFPLQSLRTQLADGKLSARNTKRLKKLERDRRGGGRDCLYTSANCLDKMLIEPVLSFHSCRSPGIFCRRLLLLFSLLSLSLSHTILSTFCATLV